MIFSKACEYGIKACVYIALQSMEGKRTNLKDISAEIDSPEAFTAKILQMLVRAGIIDSVKGAWGGFEIEKKSLGKIRLLDIVMAIDGTLEERSCVLGLKECSAKHPCPVHDKYKSIKSDLLAMMRNTTLSEMSQNVNAGLACLRY